ncbi:MAG: hypothetical protein GEU90_20695 [Gemmatimonas sp.]|nr:hypothetical protein [Gemmatimonas sp.]
MSTATGSQPAVRTDHRGRVRVWRPSQSRQDWERARRYLLGRPGILRIQSYPLTGSVVIEYEVRTISACEILALTGTGSRGESGQRWTGWAPSARRTWPTWARINDLRETFSRWPHTIGRYFNVLTLRRPSDA